MRSTPIFLVGAAVCLWATPVTGQVSARLSVGATASNNLVKDGVLGITLRPALAPTVTAGLVIPTGKGPFRLILEGGFASSRINVDDDGVSDQLASLTTITILALGEGPIRGALRWQLGGGAIAYRPSEQQGVFQQGGVTRWMIAGGLIWSHRLTPAMELLLTGRIDTQEFTTPALQTAGYGSHQSVQRAALLVGVSRRF